MRARRVRRSGAHEVLARTIFLLVVCISAQIFPANDVLSGYHRPVLGIYR